LICRRGLGDPHIVKETVQIVAGRYGLSNQVVNWIYCCYSGRCRHIHYAHIHVDHEQEKIWRTILALVSICFTVTTGQLFDLVNKRFVSCHIVVLSLSWLCLSLMSTDECDGS